MRKINNILVVGLGGIGSHLLTPLLRFLSSEKFDNTVYLVDGDRYEEHNAMRQNFAEHGVGEFKADCLADSAMDTFDTLEILPINEYINKENIGVHVTDGDVVFLCVDNHFCRRVFDEHMSTLNNCTLINGGNELLDGNAQIVLRENGVYANHSICERHPEVAKHDDADRAEMSCEELAELPSNDQIIFVNLFVATIMLNLFWTWMKDELKVYEVYCDIRQSQTSGRSMKGVASAESL